MLATRRDLDAAYRLGGGTGLACGSCARGGGGGGDDWTGGLSCTTGAGGGDASLMRSGARGLSVGGGAITRGSGLNSRVG